MGIPNGRCVLEYRPYHTLVTITFHSTWTMAQISIDEGVDLISFTGDYLNMLVKGKSLLSMVTPKYFADVTSLMGVLSI